MTLRDEEAWVTAYALGELDGEERVRFEARLEADEGLQNEVQALRALSRDLTSTLTANAPTALSDDRRAIVERALEAMEVERARPEVSPLALRHTIPRAALPTPSRLERAPWLFSGVLAAAALLAIFLGPATKSDRTPASVASASASAAPEEQQGKMGGLLAPDPRAAPTTAPPSDDDDAFAPQARDKVTGNNKAFEGWYCDPHDPACAELESPKPLQEGKLGLSDGLQFEPRPVERAFTQATADRRSTFSIDVDTAGYALLRRKVNEGAIIAPDTVRIEEMVNAFHYAYPEPRSGPIGVHVEATSTPWSPSHRLVRIGLRAREAPLASRRASNLVFLIDVSGSMNAPDRLPLLKRGLGTLVSSLDARDRVAIVAYSGTSEVVLPSTPGDRHRAIEEALAKLASGGATDGGGGIELAYAEAQRGFVKGGINRVLLATDGDFNLGLTNDKALSQLVQREAKGGVFLSVLGVGMGDLRDERLERLASDGNGLYAYLDSADEARRVLGDQAAGTLVTVAKDVKVQVEWDPTIVSAYRLVGYDNRRLAASAFRDDAKGAGEMGASHAVTALYEVVLVASENDRAKLGTLLLRFKQPDADTSEELRTSIVDTFGSIEEASTDTKFALAVAALGLRLRRSPAVDAFGLPEILRLAAAGRGADPTGERRAFSDLVTKLSVPR